MVTAAKSHRVRYNTAADGVVIRDWGSGAHQTRVRDDAQIATRADEIRAFAIHKIEALQRTAEVTVTVIPDIPKRCSYVCQVVIWVRCCW